MRTDTQTLNVLHLSLKIGTKVLKAQNGVYALPAVPNKHKEEYHCKAENLQYLKCRPDKLTSQIYGLKNEQYKYLAEYAFGWLGVFHAKMSGLTANKAFAKLRAKLKAELQAVHRQGQKGTEKRNLQECVTAVMKDLRQTARTREQSINTAKLLYQLADRAVRLAVEETLSEPVAEHIESEDIVCEPEPCMEFG